MVMLTSKATAAVQQLIASSDPDIAGLRVMVKDGGCSGYQYMMNLESSPDAEDEVHSFDTIKVFIDPTSKPLLSSVTIDYVEDITGVGFKFENLNATATCGCGSSFSIDSQSQAENSDPRVTETACSRRG